MISEALKKQEEITNKELNILINTGRNTEVEEKMQKYSISH